MFLCPLSHTVQTPFQPADNQHGVIEHLNFGLGANERPPSRQLSVLPSSSSVFSSIFHDLRLLPFHPSRHPLRTCLVNSCRRVVSFRGGQNLPRTTPRTPRYTSFLLSFRPPHGLPQGLVPPQSFDNSTVDTMKSRAPLQLCAQRQADILLKKVVTVGSARHALLWRVLAPIHFLCAELRLSTVFLLHVSSSHFYVYFALLHY